MALRIVSSNAPRGTGRSRARVGHGENISERHHHRPGETSPSALKSLLDMSKLQRHFVPGYYQPVPPGQKPFGPRAPRLKLTRMGHLLYYDHDCTRREMAAGNVGLVRRFHKCSPRHLEDNLSPLGIKRASVASHEGSFAQLILNRKLNRPCYHPKQSLPGRLWPAF